MDAMNERYAFTFPPADLMASLISLYFSEYNVFSPLLHRPTFERSIEIGLHLRDNKFASVVLLVCALGARASDDPRVLLPVELMNLNRKGKSKEERTYHSAGWMYFEQVHKSKLALSFLPVTLYDMQMSYVRRFCYSYVLNTHSHFIAGRNLRVGNA